MLYRVTLILGSACILHVCPGFDIYDNPSSPGYTLHLRRRISARVFDHVADDETTSAKKTEKAAEGDSRLGSLSYLIS